MTKEGMDPPIKPAPGSAPGSADDEGGASGLPAVLRGSRASRDVRNGCFPAHSPFLMTDD